MVLDNNMLSFSTNEYSRPFNGVFDAIVSAQVYIDESNFTKIQESPAYLSVAFVDSSEKYQELEERINEILYSEWLQKI